MVAVLFCCAIISAYLINVSKTMSEQIFDEIQAKIHSGDVEALTTILNTLNIDDITHYMFTVHDTALLHANVQTVSESAAAGYELGLLDAIDTYNILSLYIVMM
jgi:hypothetical protein